MKKPFRILKKEYYLDGAGIESASELISSKLEEWKVERQNRLRIRLSLEENLLRFRDHFGESVPFVMTIVRRFHKLFFQIELDGEIYNPLSKSETEMQDWSAVLMNSVGIAPRFSYTGGTNTLRLSLRREGMNPVLRLLIAIALGAFIGLILYAVLSENDAKTFTVTVGSPVYSLLYYILNLISGPVIFFMVLSTITGFAQYAGKGTSYVRVLLRFFFISIAFAIAAAGVTIWICQVPIHTDVLDQKKFMDMFDNIIHVIPEDFFEAFMDASTPQLLFLAFVIGAAMNVLSERTVALKKVVDQINGVGMLITEWVSKLIPLFVFMLIIVEFTDRMQNDLLHIWLPLVISLGCAALIMAAAILYTAWRKHVPVKKLIRKLWPPFKEALKTGSLSDSYGLLEKSCRMGLGIDKEFTMASLSHGLILYMPGSIVSVVIFCIYAAGQTNNHITYLWLAGLILLANILSIAAPPIPGVDMLVYIAIINDLDIQGNILIPALIFDMIFGILAGAMNQMMLQVEMIHHADRVGLLNRKLLQK